MKLFIVGEGRNDIGELCDMPQYRAGSTGYFPPLLRTMLGDEIEIDGQKITLLGRDQPKSKRKTTRKKAEFAAALAAAVDADALVYSGDADHDFVNRRAKLAADLAGSDVPWAIAMPKETVEAWILGDEGSMAAVAPDVQRPANPEGLWGAPHDSASNHPKQVLARLAGGTLSQDDYDQAGAHALPSRLCTSCPSSFRPFADEVAAITGRFPCTP